MPLTACCRARSLQPAHTAPCHTSHAASHHARYCGTSGKDLTLDHVVPVCRWVLLQLIRGALSEGLLHGDAVKQPPLIARAPSTPTHTTYSGAA